MYTADFHPDWKYWFDQLDNSVKIPIAKKMKKILEGLPTRHLEYNVPYFIAEVDQYRICYRKDDDNNIRRFYFAGTHKNYLKWIHGEGANIE